VNKNNKTSPELVYLASEVCRQLVDNASKFTPSSFNVEYQGLATKFTLIKIIWLVRGFSTREKERQFGVWLIEKARAN